MGAHSQLNDIEDNEMLEEFVSFRPLVEAKLGAAEFTEFTPVKFTKQVVAGMIFHIKYRVGGGETDFLHARVIKYLPHTG